MRFEIPWCWLVLPPLLAYLAWLSRRSDAQLVPAARWGSLALRGAILVGLIAALSRPSWMGPVNGPDAAQIAADEQIPMGHNPLAAAALPTV